jgi:dihydroorotate dehydrogenase (NAD+) catalytic subunit
VIARVFSGLSGPALKPVALRQVYQVAAAVEIPVIGCGGISTARDAIEFLMAGAVAVQVGTASFANPLAALEVLEGIERYCAGNGVARIGELVGVARREPAL